MSLTLSLSSVPKEYLCAGSILRYTSVKNRSAAGRVSRANDGTPEVYHTRDLLDPRLRGGGGGLGSGGMSARAIEGARR